MIEAALQDAQLKQPQELTHCYFNGFDIGLSNADVLITLKRNDKIVAQLNASFTVAKTLGLKLTHTIGMLEAGSGQPVMSTDEVGKYLLSQIQNRPAIDEHATQ